jgi:hypothetical protein
VNILPCRCADFDFKRLGMRTAVMALSPWIPKGTVVQVRRHHNLSLCEPHYGRCWL